MREDTGRAWQTYGLMGELYHVPDERAGASVITQQGVLLAATNGAVYRSTNDGATWQKVSEGLLETAEMRVLHIDFVPA